MQLAIDDRPQGPRWTGQAMGRDFVIGDLDARFLSVTFRQQLVLFPGLALQAYAQLFTAAGSYGASFTGRGPGPIRFADLMPTPMVVDGFHQTALKVNLVMRWEYRLGSVIYAIYSHNGESLPAESGHIPSSLSPAGLLDGRAADTFSIKWSYFWQP